MQSIKRAAAGASLLAAFAVFAAGPSQALTLFDQDYTCPIGGEKFKAKTVGSHSQFGVRLDLRPVGALLAPIPLPVCPGNGFVMFKDSFTPEELKALEPIVLSPEYRATRQQHTDYYMVAFMRERQSAPPLELARYYHRASWQAEGPYSSDRRSAYEKPELVTQYRTLALQKFDAFLQQDQSYSNEWWTAAIIAAELERLLGRFDAAGQRIDRLPLDKLATGSLGRKAIEQIREHANNRNAEPQKFVKR